MRSPEFPQPSGDEDLERLFAPAVRELDDSGFTAVVMRHVRMRRGRLAIRTAVVGLAGAVGAAFALGPVIDLLAALAGTLRASGFTLVGAYRGLDDAAQALGAMGAVDPRALAVAVAVLCVLAWPLLVRWLGR